MALVARREDGTIVNPGDSVVSRRGETMKFISPAPARRKGDVVGKVIVEEDGQQQLYDDLVFELVITDE